MWEGNSVINELLKFVRLELRFDLNTYAMESVLGLTGTAEGLEVIYDEHDLLVTLISLLNDSTMPLPIVKDACLSLINISANEKGAAALLNANAEIMHPPLRFPPENIVQECLIIIFDNNSPLADHCCKILSNLSRSRFLIEKIVDAIEKSGRTLDDIIEIFMKTRNFPYNKLATLDYLGAILSNLSQSQRIRNRILNKNKCVIQRLLPFTEYKDSLIRRGGVVGTLKNCCFETDFHEWLLSEDVDILPRLLLPLAGPEEFDEEDNDKLPLELQYLPETKTREEDPDIRCILIEAITQLCSKRINREFIRGKNAYIILRELHKSEQDKKVLIACENLVDILIRNEDEIVEDNLKDVNIPNHLIQQFDKVNEEL